MEYITNIGKWKLYKIDNQDPVEYCIVNEDKVFYNRGLEAAARLAELLNEKGDFKCGI